MRLSRHYFDKPKQSLTPSHEPIVESGQVKLPPIVPIIETYYQEDPDLNKSIIAPSIEPYDDDEWEYYWEDETIPPTWTVPPPQEMTILESYSTSFTIAADGDGPIVYSVTGLPASATIDSSTGYFSWTPTSGDMLAMPYTGVFTATNDGGCVSSGIIPVEYNITSGLVGWWKLNGNALDSSSYGNNGTIFGALPSGDRFGRESGAMYFDGVNDYISTLVSGFPRLQDNLSISMWIKTISGANQKNFIAIQCSSNALQIGYKMGAPSLVAWKWGGVELLSSCILPTGVWNHVTYVQTGINRNEVYINGMIAGSGEVVRQIGNPTTCIFGKYTIGGTYLHAILYNARVYNYSLSSGEIAQLYHYIG